MMASGEGSPRTSREVTMDALLVAIMSVKNDLSGQMERMEGRMDGMEGSFSRRMDTLEVRLDSNHSSLKHYHASTSGYATTPDTFPQLLNPPRPTHEPIHQVPTYPKNQSQFHQEASQILDPLDMPRAPLNQNQPIQIDDVEGEGLYVGEGLDEATLFTEFMRNRRRVYGGGHRGRGGRVSQAPHGRGNLGHRPHVQEGLVYQGGNVGRDMGLNSIKITLSAFKGTNDPSLYLDWELQFEPPNHCLAWFKGGLCYKVISQLVVHKFDRIEDLVEAAIEVERNNHAKKTFGWYKSYKSLEKKPFDKTIQRYPRLEVAKNNVSEGTPQEDDGYDGEPEMVVEEGKVNMPCGLMRRTPHDDALLEESEEVSAEAYQLTLVTITTDDKFGYGIETVEEEEEEEKAEEEEEDNADVSHTREYNMEDDILPPATEEVGSNSLKEGDIKYKKI
ncbi:putative magnesium protoporphyrin IX methyltransferase, chloroplastic-like [Capsicum annuum]|uniref:Uncharacterized protein n=1 Tax=Capsicum annuum TaxID=4072 RepID=A0A2G2Y603_CAPAN|nr:putative magnesium protoporphyrin IX methyltransferase, chloroplastic-like [Capsicum annuum]PHT65152.1 hypothetical protein T459_29577 [Capsicum annuum]